MVYIRDNRDLRYYVNAWLFGSHSGDCYPPYATCEMCPSLDNDDLKLVPIVPAAYAGPYALTTANFMLLCKPCRNRVAGMTVMETTIASILLTRTLPFDFGQWDKTHLVKNKTHGDLAPRDGNTCRVCDRPYTAERPPHAGHIIAKRNKNTAKPIPDFIVHSAENFARMCKPCNDTMGTRTPTLTPDSLRLILKPWADGKSLSASYLRDERQFAKRVPHLALVRTHVTVSSSQSTASAHPQPSEHLGVRPYTDPAAS